MHVRVRGVCIYDSAAHYGAAPHRDRPKKETIEFFLQDKVVVLDTRIE